MISTNHRPFDAFSQWSELSQVLGEGIVWDIEGIWSAWEALTDAELSALWRRFKLGDGSERPLTVDKVNQCAQERIAKLQEMDLGTPVVDDRLAIERLPPVLQLLSARAYLNAPYAEPGTLLLHVLHHGTTLEEFKLLMTMDPRLDVGDADGNTALHHAILRGPEIVRDLCEAGADVNAQNLEGKTPLMLAVRYFQSEVVTVLLEQESLLLETEDNQGNTALNVWAEHRTATDRIGPLLIQAKADVNTQNHAGDTPLHRLGRARSRKGRGWKLLCKAGADRSLKNGLGDRPYYAFDSRITLKDVCRILPVLWEAPFLLLNHLHVGNPVY